MPYFALYFLVDYRNINEEINDIHPDKYGSHAVIINGIHLVDLNSRTIRSTNSQWGIITFGRGNTINKIVSDILKNKRGRWQTRSPWVQISSEKEPNMARHLTIKSLVTPRCRWASSLNDRFWPLAAILRRHPQLSDSTGFGDNIRRIRFTATEAGCFSRLYFSGYTT